MDEYLLGRQSMLRYAKIDSSDDDTTTFNVEESSGNFIQIKMKTSHVKYFAQKINFKLGDLCVYYDEKGIARLDKIFLRRSTKFDTFNGPHRPITDFITLEEWRRTIKMDDDVNLDLDGNTFSQNNQFNSTVIYINAKGVVCMQIVDKDKIRLVNLPIDKIIPPNKNQDTFKITARKFCIDIGKLYGELDRSGLAKQVLSNLHYNKFHKIDYEKIRIPVAEKESNNLYVAIFISLLINFVMIFLYVF